MFLEPAAIGLLLLRKNRGSFHCPRCKCMVDIYSVEDTVLKYMIYKERAYFYYELTLKLPTPVAKFKRRDGECIEFPINQSGIDFICLNCKYSSNNFFAFIPFNSFK